MRNLASYLLLFISISLPTQSFGQEPLSNLTFQEAEAFAGDYFRQAISEYANQIEADWRSGVLRSGEYKMPFVYSINGECPERGFPLYISMHGGGGAPAEVNDEQWENQMSLYGAVDGVYFVPRAPTDTWNMWHQEYMDDFLLQIVSYAVVRLNVNPLRVYILGYSAGGDGVYNLASRLSDRFAAAAMMAGHPGDAEIENLRNLPFSIYVGESDTNYNRVGLASEWLVHYQRLNGEDPDGFWYNVNIYEGKGHWMDGEDGAAIGWLADFQRRCNPDRVIWIQDDVLHSRKYNLEVRNPKQGDRIEQRVDRDNNTISIVSDHYDEVTIWLDDYIADLDRDVTIIFNGKEVFRGLVAREERNIVESINGRLDAEYIFWGKVSVRRD